FFFFFFSLPLCFSLFPYTTLFRSSSLFSVSLLFSDVCDLDPSDRGGVREHPGERTRTGGIEPARYRTPEMVQASAGRDDVVRPPWIPRNRPHAVRAGALTPSAAAYEVGARFLPPTVVTRPEGPISRGGSARR